MLSKYMLEMLNNKSLLHLVIYNKNAKYKQKQQLQSRHAEEAANCRI